MRVFLSYASEDREQAKLIAASIGARGHKVFFDRDDLPAGQSYEDQIEDAIRRSALMVFLISPNSIEPGRFTRTELAFAQRNWHQARNRVLPVMLRPTPINQVPSYLRTVTILEPEGNISAEVAAAVNQLSWRASRWIKRIGVALLVAAGAVVAVEYLKPPTALFEVKARVPMPWDRGFFGIPDKYRISLSAKNKGEVAGKLLRVSFESKPSDALMMMGGSYEPALDKQIVPPGSAFNGSFLVSASGNADKSEWRSCFHFNKGKELCTSFIPWKTRGKLLYGDRFPIDPKLAQGARAVAYARGAFLIATTEPNQLIRMDENGRVLLRKNLPGLPTALAIVTGKNEIDTAYVGVGDPDLIVKFDPITLNTEASRKINFPDSVKKSMSEPIATRPANLAWDGEQIWVITRGGASQNGLAYLDANLDKLHVPPFYDDISFDLPGLRLRPGDGAVWTGDVATTPSSLRRLTTDVLTVFGGHDYELVSCANDVLSDRTGVVVNDCKGYAHRVLIKDGRLSAGDRIDNLLGYSNPRSTWSTVLLGRAPNERYFASVNIRTSQPHDPNSVHQASLVQFDWSKGGVIKLQANRSVIEDMALGTKGALIILKSDNGQSQLVAPAYDYDKN